MTQQDHKAGAEPKASAPVGADATRPHWTSRWRSNYRPGSWLVLSGPTSMVVMQPAAPQWSELINAVWEDVVDSASLKQIAARMADFRLDQMPDFAALFWEGGEMRSLVRGRVQLIDPETGHRVADGEGVLTWSEVGLGDLQRVQIDAGEQDEEDRLELPLVIGAVNASRVLLDCSDEAQISSPQGTFVGDPAALDRIDADQPQAAEPNAATSADPVSADVAPADSAVSAAAPAAAGAAVGTTADHQAPDHQAPDHQAPDHQAPDHQAPDRQPADHAAAVPPAQPVAAAPSPTPYTDQPGGTSDGRTEQVPNVPASPNEPGSQPPRQVLGVLHPSSGGVVDVDRPVVIGRSPVASRVRSDQLPRLLTVPSPSHDISRTHVQIAPENGRLVVTDLNSTNGTILVLPDGRRADLRPGVGVPLDYGSVIDLGDGVTIAVDRQ